MLSLKSWKLPVLKSRRRLENTASVQPRQLRIETLEERVLFSATMIDLPGDVRPVDTSVMSALMIPPMAETSEPGGGGANKPNTASETNLPPIYLGMPPIIFSEDANERSVDLTPYFDDPESAGALSYQLLNANHPELFDRLQLVGSRLYVNPRADMFGVSTTTIRVTDSTGMSTDFSVPVNILPVNDRPTTSGLGNYFVDDGSTIVINLFAMFNDKEDSDELLTFSITENTNPNLFSSIEMNRRVGTLTFTLKPDIDGTSLITLRATDSEGSYVEMKSNGRNFKIYDLIRGDAENSAAIGLSNFNFATHWALFDLIDGEYDYSHFSPQRLTEYLDSEYFDPTRPTVFDIENDYYTNTPAGRERFAEVLRSFRQQAPQGAEVGVYAFIPEFDYWAPVQMRRSQEDVARGVLSGYVYQAATLQADYDAWLARNALYREAPLSDGTHLADWVSWVTPSLYTFYGFDYNPAIAPLDFSFQLDGASNRLSVADTQVANGQKIEFEITTARVPSELTYYTEYYVVNSNGHSFQLSTTEGGVAIDFSDSAAGSRYLRLVGPRNHLEHDPDVAGWRVFAEDMVAESRRFNARVVPWLSPSFKGLGSEFLDKNFFRMQLDTMLELADGVSIWMPNDTAGALPENHGWVEALTEFTSYLHNSTQFKIVSTVKPTNLDGLANGYARRTDRFENAAEPAFAAAPYRYDSTGANSLRDGGGDFGSDGEGLAEIPPSASNQQASQQQAPASRALASSRNRVGEIIAIGAHDRLNLQPTRTSRAAPRAPLSSKLVVMAPMLQEEDTKSDFDNLDRAIRLLDGAYAEK